MAEKFWLWVAWVERMDTWWPQAVFLLLLFSPILLVMAWSMVAPVRAWKRAWRRFPGPGWEPAGGERFDDGEVAMRYFGFDLRVPGTAIVTLQDKGILVQTRSWMVTPERSVFLPWKEIVKVEVTDSLFGWSVKVWVDERDAMVCFREGAAQRIGQAFARRAKERDGKANDATRTSSDS